MEEPYVYAYPQGTSPSAPPSPQSSGSVGVIVEPRFCVSYPVQMVIVKKMMKLTNGNFVITDVNGNLLFKVKEPVFGFHDKRVLLDASGTPVLTMRQKVMSLHDRWQVFRGGSTDQCDLLYTVKRSSMLQFKTKLDIFLGLNNEEKRSDFRVKWNWHERSCIVYAGEADSIVAQMHKKHTEKDNFLVMVYPDVDYAFIVSLIIILDDVNREGRVYA